MFALVVTWDEPETDLAVYGPYNTQSEANAAWNAHVSADFKNEGELPLDVQVHVRPLTPGW